MGSTYAGSKIVRQDIRRAKSVRRQMRREGAKCEAIHMQGEKFEAADMYCRWQSVRQDKSRWLDV